MENAIQNTMFANNTISATLVGRDSLGIPGTSGNERYAAYRAASAITKGQVVAFAAGGQSAGTPLSVEPMAVAANARMMVGVATKDAAAGSVCFICTEGLVDVAIPNSTPAYGDALLKPAANAGEGTTSATVDQTTVAGSVIGTIVAVKSGNFAVCYVCRV